MDDAIEQMFDAALVPVMAVGNAPGLALGSRGCYIAGTGTEFDNELVQLTAPEELICCQPPLAALEHDHLSCHRGSSLASAFVTGVVMQLSARTSNSVRNCVNALVKTRNPDTRCIRPDDAYWLLKTGKI
jgi:hypothetical protein